MVQFQFASMFRLFICALAIIVDLSSAPRTALGQTSANGQQTCMVNGKSIPISPYKTQGNYINCQFFPYGAFVDPSVCIGGNQSASFALCGTNVNLNSQQILDAYNKGMPFYVPPPYDKETYTLQCVSTMRGFSWIPDSSGVTCMAEQCPASRMQICGQQLPIPGGTNVGQRASTAILTDWLSSYAQGFSHSVISECVLQNGAPTYQFVNTDFVGCNDFACSNTAVTLCGQQIPIKGGAAVGDIISALMPPPFVPDPVKIQCVGNDSAPPTYRVDSSAVSCNRLNAANGQ